MNKNINDFITIIQKGPHKGMRLHNEDKCGGEHTFPVEMYFLFQNAFKFNYNIYYLSCTPNHNITISEFDLNFLKTSITIDEDYKIKQHIFSDDTLKIKNLQYKDLLCLYDISINSGKINAISTTPSLKNNLYCFDIFIITNNDFELNKLLDLKFNIIKINSVIQYYENTLNIELFQNKYDLLNLQFKDYLIPYDELKKTRPYDIFSLPEKIELDNFYKKILFFENKNPNTDSKHFDKHLKFLEEKLSKKKDELFNIELYKKLNMSKLCMHFYIFNKNIMHDTIFFTNFNQLVSGILIKSENNEIKYDYDDLHHYSLEDMLIYDQYKMFTIFLLIYQ